MPGALGGQAQVPDDHMVKDENVLFPMMQAGGNPAITHLIAAMRHEHDLADRQMQRMLDVTQGLQLPEGACRNRAALYTGLRKLTTDPTAHRHLENEVPFPRYEAACPAREALSTGKGVGRARADR